jgi:hypothetical protein
VDNKIKGEIMTEPKKTSSKKKPYKKKDYGPSRAELMRSDIESDILEFWKEMATSTDVSATQPWVMNMLKAESAFKYLSEDKRYVYQGGFNQWMIAYATKNYDSEMAPLIMTQSQVCQLFDVKKIYETEFSQEGNRSHFSIFRPLMGNRYTYPTGIQWESPEGDHRRPTTDEIARMNLQRREVITGFGSAPTYSMADLYPFLPDDQKQKVDGLVKLRRGKARELNPEDSVEAYINNFVDDIIKRQGLEVTKGGNSASYHPGTDRVKIPAAEQFTNPVFYLAVVAHELGHSTMHLNGRMPSLKGDKLGYAVEEIVAETMAAMIIKVAEKELMEITNGRPDVQAMFKDFYKNSQSYVRDYGNTAKFTQMVQEIEKTHVEEQKKNKTFTVKSVMTKVAKAMDSVLNKSYSPDQRLEAKDANQKKLKAKVNKDMASTAPAPG